MNFFVKQVIIGNQLRTFQLLRTTLASLSPSRLIPEVYSIILQNDGVQSCM